jgi:hypothetical protein
MRKRPSSSRSSEAQPAATDSFALRLQRISTDGDRLLVAGELAGLRNGTRRFTTSEAVALLRALYVPAPANPSARLADAARKALLVRVGKEWGVSPEGRIRVSQLFAHLDVAQVEAELASTPGAVLGSVRHSVLGPTFAPQRWARPVANLTSEFPFERNVFLMTRYPDASSAGGGGPVAPLIDDMRKTISAHGLVLHLAGDRQLDDDLWGNVAAHMWACQYGIGVLEARPPNSLNYNVVIEMGAMLVTGRRCALLRDEVSAPALPTDFVGQIYKSVNLDDRRTVVEAVHGWAARDLGLGECESCPVAALTTASSN